MLALVVQSNMSMPVCLLSTLSLLFSMLIVVGILLLAIGGKDFIVLIIITSVMIFIVICCGYLYASYLKIKSAMELIELETDIDQIGAHLSDTVAYHTCNCPRANRHYCSRAERRLQLQASPDDLRTERCNQTYDHLPKSLQSGQLPLYDEVVQENSTDYSIPPPTYAECVGNSSENAEDITPSPWTRITVV